MKKLEIQESDIISTITSYDKRQSLRVADDLVLDFLLKVDSTGVGLLLCVQAKGEDDYVQFACWFLSDLIDEAQSDEPIIVLQQLAIKFGLTIRIGDFLNKFIFKETIPLKPGQENELMKIHASKKDIIATQFIKVEVVDEKKVAKCALAFAIDRDPYLAWIKKQEVQEPISVDIAPQMKSSITYYDLIRAESSLEFTMPNSQLGTGRGGILFRVRHPDYLLEAGFTEKSVYILRNSARLDYEIDVDSPLQRTSYLIGWSPEKIILVCVETTDKNGNPLGPDKLPSMESRTKTLKTNATIPPNSLLEWARKQSIAQTTVYQSESEFYQAVIAALQTISDKVESITMQNPFWDISYDGNKIISRSPKKETDIHPTIHGLLSDIALAKNFQIAREFHIAGGQLDFLISGSLRTGKVVSVCVEFKHAHSTDLKHGLTVQLPAYMKAKASDFGIYCVMYFKGIHFSEPAGYDYGKLQVELSILANSKGLSNIRIIVFDFSYPISPSKV